MANYKVIQDIEAEDKLVGPLSLRQFIYAAIAALSGYLSLLAVEHGLGLLLIFLIPPMLFTGFFAFPWGRDQSTEVWALAKIRYFIKSRKRLWDQSGVKDLVTITAPKHIARQYTNGLSTSEVANRLSALASTLDTRGWAVKNVNTYMPPMMQQTANEGSDRLLGAAMLPQDVPAVDIRDEEDMFDVYNNPRAQAVSNMVVASSTARKEHLLETMRSVNSAPGNLPAPFVAPSSMLPPVIQPNAPFADQSEQQLADQLRTRQSVARQATADQHGPQLQPLVPIAPTMPVAQLVAVPTDTMQPTVQASSIPAPAPPMTAGQDAATINLASNNDLTVATIARIANKQDEDTGEVVIPLRHRSS